MRGAAGGARARSGSHRQAALTAPQSSASNCWPSRECCGRRGPRILWGPLPVEKEVVPDLSTVVVFPPEPLCLAFLLMGDAAMPHDLAIADVDLALQGMMSGNVTSALRLSWSFAMD